MHSKNSTTYAIYSCSYRLYYLHSILCLFHTLSSFDNCVSWFVLFLWGLFRSSLLRTKPKSILCINSQHHHHPVVCRAVFSSESHFCAEKRSSLTSENLLLRSTACRCRLSTLNSMNTMRTIYTIAFCESWEPTRIRDEENKTKEKIWRKATQKTENDERDVEEWQREEMEKCK